MCRIKTRNHAANFGLLGATVLSLQPQTDPVARHAQWVSSPALGALLPHLQEGARDLLSDLVAARARISAPATTATAASPPVAARSSGGGTTGTAAASDRGCTCALAVAEQWSRDEARSGGACRGETCGVEARSRSRSVEPQSRGGQQQCAVCAGVSDGADCSRGGVSCGGGGETAGVAAAAVVAAAVGLGVRHGVVEKSAASLKKECETLRMVVQALREKDEDSQASAYIVLGPSVREVDVKAVRAKSRERMGVRGRTRALTGKGILIRCIGSPSFLWGLTPNTVHQLEAACWRAR